MKTPTQTPTITLRPQVECVPHSSPGHAKPTAPATSTLRSQSERTEWAKMPCWWQKSDHVHNLIGKAPVAVGIASLKLYIALCVKANFRGNAKFTEGGCVQLSVERLAELVGVSKPVVIKALRALREWGLIRTDSSKRPAIHQIAKYEGADYWTKLPSMHLRASASPRVMGRLSKIANRGKTPLHALQLYLYLAVVRDRRSEMACVGYVRLTEVLGLSRNEVSRAISAAVNQQLISVRPGRGGLSNEYWLLGMRSNLMRAAE